MIRVAINGFGRIGRRFFRLAEERDIGFEIVAINDLTDPATLAHLLHYDSVHGTFGHEIGCDGNNLIVDGRSIRVLAERDPAKLPWKELKVDIVLEATGFFRQHKDASLHLAAGASRVVISAPAGDPDITVCYGINHQKISRDDKIISNASCTTNCLAPVVSILQDNWGIESGLMTTIHSYTNDQRILDLPHSDLRRARAAAQSMIPTSTGAAKAIGLVLPELLGRLNGIAVRVPTPNVSMVDLTVHTGKPISVEAANAAFKAAAQGPLKGVLVYEESPLVSIDFNGSTASSTLDAGLTMSVGDHHLKVIAWYDNETGYSCRLVDLIDWLGSH